MKYTALLPLLLVGCSTTPNHPNYGQVRVVPSGLAATSCQFIGPVRSWKPVLAGGSGAAHRDIRNQVAAAGGNALVIISQVYSDQGHAEIMGEAYRCPTAQGTSPKGAASAVHL
jgi:hypothetical protein